MWTFHGRRMFRALFLALTVLGSAACSLDWDDDSRPREDAGSGDPDGALDAGDDAGGPDEGVDGGGVCDGGCCEPGGAGCAECAGPEDCSAEAPVCDTATSSCRGCTSESECGAGNICVEATGTCTAAADAAFVTQMGSDTGTCTRAAPCATIAYAIAQLGARKVIHVLGGSLFTDALMLTASDGLVLDGEDTMLSASGTVITVQDAPAVTIEGFRFTTPSAEDTPAITASGPGAPTSVRIHDVSIGGDGGLPVVAGFNSRVSITSSHLGSLAASTALRVTCTDARLSVAESRLETTILDGTRCELTISRSRFESSYDGSVSLLGGLLVMENNLIIHRDGFNDSMSVSGLSAGSTIRFNTIANTTALPSDGRALSCDDTVVVTSNVFAYYSAHPIGGTGCAPRYSVFDDESLTSAGTGNQVAPIDELFVDRSAGDFHLASDSVARGAAEPGQTMVTVDHEGSPRPSPAGSVSDSGAFEAP
jgi:hypothetical protein